MGSIQQVTMGAVCLAAAFAFGSYLNHPGHLNQQSGVAELGGQSDSAGQPIRSLIAIEPQVEKRPAQTPWMQPNLHARFPMPNLPDVEVPNVDRSEFGVRTGKLGNAAQSINKIPPPSDLSGRLAAAKPRVETFSRNVVEDAPDFSRQATVAPAMPTVAGPKESSVGNLASSFSKGLAASSLRAVEDAPVFGRSARMDTQPQLTPTAAIQPVQTQPLIVADRLAPVVRKQAFDDRRTRVDVYDTANINLRSGENLTRFRSAKPAVSVQADNPQSVGRLTSVLDKNPSDDAVDGSSYDANQRRVTRLPFRLNQEAHTNLVRLRDQATHKISLNTTQFSDYVVEAGDTLQTISTRHFGKPDYYLDIYLANRNQLNSPGELQDGMMLRIPVYQ